MYKSITDYKQDMDNLLKEDGLNKSQKDFMNSIFEQVSNMKISNDCTMAYFNVWYIYVKNLRDNNYISELSYTLCIDLINDIEKRVLKLK